MKKMIVIGILGMVLVSLAGAGLVGFLRDSVSVEVTVEGPVFYLDGTKIVYETTEYRTLKLNDDDVSFSKLLLDKEENIWYVSEPLGVDDFYDEKYKITLYLSAEEITNTTKTGTVIVNLWLENKGSLCNTQIIGIPQDDEDYDKYIVECTPKDVSLKDIASTDRIMLSVEDAPMGIRNRINTEDSKVEVLAR